MNEPFDTPDAKEESSIENILDDFFDEVDANAQFKMDQKKAELEDSENSTPNINEESEESSKNIKVE
jgi:hypothetical protein